MHSMGLHSALAIKRQRKRRADLKRAKERRFSIQSTESGLGGSHSSFASPRKRKQSKNKVGGFEANVGIGMLHIGVVFIVLGVFLLGSTLIPSDLDNWEWQNIFSKKAWWNELVITGAFSLLLGIFLIVLDRFITKREEDDLNKYVQGQLTRSRSGHRLVRDVETGNLVSRSRSKTMTGICDEVRSQKDPVKNSPGYNTGNHIFMNGETEMLSPQLEKIMEEDVSGPVESYRGIERNVLHEEYDSTTASISPGSPSETQELLVGNTGFALNAPVPSKYHQVRMSRM
ncbi:UNVERIFIED_CONTAM: hypothetical protein PYX00_000698 [Menopon gallinae]|uniref:Uncharacterized protein n=1 Tax=Menopon gallinae TaxID=328185 RepID=A0AAW2IAX9_9NEOP